MPMPPELKKIRHYIDANYPEFLEIITSKPFSTVYQGLDVDPGYTLTRVPKGFEADNPAAEYLKFKSFTATIPITDKVIQSPKLLPITIAAFQALIPFNIFLNKAIN